MVRGEGGNSIWEAKFCYWCPLLCLCSQFSLHCTASCRHNLPLIPFPSFIAFLSNPSIPQVSQRSNIPSYVLGLIQLPVSLLPQVKSSSLAVHSELTGYGSCLHLLPVLHPISSLLQQALHHSRTCLLPHLYILVSLYVWLHLLCPW